MQNGKPDQRKKGIRTMGLTIAFAIIAALGLLAWIRLAPSDPAYWHVDIADPGFVPPPGWAAWCPLPGSRHFVQGSTLASVAAVADAAPRTMRLAGSVEEQRITWITRTRLLGFPDYTTAAVVPTSGGPQVCMVARQRFGLRDGGVNARRVQDWLMAAQGRLEPPALHWGPQANP
jgi:Protein of unknown function (DUF1499)